MAEIKTTGPNLPEIYIYTTPGVSYHEGWAKIGDTQGEFEKRIGQQTNTAGIIANGKLLGYAIYEDGSRKTFRDHEFHKYLRDNGINDKHPGWTGDEWFEISVEKAQELFNKFRQNPPLKHKVEMILREEQEEAVKLTVEYKEKHENGEYLWNAKPRFGKTISAMEFCKRIDAQNVLILTNKPAVANSWYEDYCDYLGPESGYVFVSETPDLKGKEYVYSRKEYLKLINEPENKKCFEFVSLQDAKGSIWLGGVYEKLKEIIQIEWDAVFIDEAHEGVDTKKTDFALDKVKRKFTLHLSGTPFKQIKNDKFDSDAIFNWTYVDEQKKKEEWKGHENPYEELPTLNLYTYRLSQLVDNTKKFDIDEDSFEYAYKLNKFFKTNNKNEFIHSDDVTKFLDKLTTEDKLPLSTEENRKALAHSFWLLPSVSACIAMKNKLENHEVFKDYEILNISGNNIKDKNTDEYEEENTAFAIVTKAIKNHKKTITLSVNRLTTGVTIPEWTSVFILSEMKSAQTYMQAAFRAQNPCIFETEDGYKRKANSYVFDFNPERSLSIFEQFANDLYSDTATGKGSDEDRKNNIIQLLKYLPVLGEDENGNLKKLTEDEVLSIPRAIRCDEVIKRGFMCNFLFTEDFSGIFRSSSVITDILNRLSQPKKIPQINISKSTKEEIYLNNNNEIEVPDEIIEQKVNEKPEHKKKIEEIAVESSKKMLNEKNTNNKNKDIEKSKKAIGKTISGQIIENIQENYDISKEAKSEINNITNKEISNVIDESNYSKQLAILEMRKEYEENFKDDTSEEELNATIEDEIKKIEKEHDNKLIEKMKEAVEQINKKSYRIAEEDKATKIKDEKENEIREHLKGFARTIPSFLMAYGNENTTLETFEKDIPDDIFEEVTSITIEEFKLLRDGREDEFEGHIFEPIVFNDSVKAFLKKKQELADYFDESQKEDIFDYIPAQQTNQIYTPKKVVKQMIELVEKENPGCFDDPNKTFIDLYMKSGLYITEIVKKLYNSEKIKALYPDSHERLKHIFEHQVYGLAPTKIIYAIATNFIFSSELTKGINTKHITMLDTQPLTENGTLKEALDKIFSNTN